MTEFWKNDRKIPNYKPTESFKLNIYPITLYWKPFVIARNCSICEWNQIGKFMAVAVADSENQ